MKRRWRGLLAGGACYLLLAGTTTGELSKYTIRGYAQGTDYTITYYAADSCIRKNTIDSVLRVIDTSMSLYKPYSLINKINAGGKGRFELDSHFYNVLKKSFAIYRDSRGIFDITVAPLVQLWGFGVKPVDHFPDSNEVRHVMDCVGMDKIRLKRYQLRKQSPCVQIDLNGIAQGYSVDVLAELLENGGVAHYVVELGGELRVKGPKPDGLPMRIGIERPSDDGSSGVGISDVMEIREGAITTAGNYRKFLQDGKRKFSHHIDPKTGYPFNTGIISATIYAKDAITADGYDNVIMAMEAGEAIRFVDKRRDMEVFVIYEDRSGMVRDTMSAGFKRLLAN